MILKEKLKDKNGVIIKPNDILLQITGSSSGLYGHSLSGNLYFLPQVIEFDGHGYHYDQNGNPIQFCWCRPSSSFVLTNASKDFVKAFKNGMFCLGIDCTEEESINQTTDKLTERINEIAKNYKYSEQEN